MQPAAPWRARPGGADDLGVDSAVRRRRDPEIAILPIDPEAGAFERVLFGNVDGKPGLDSSGAGHLPDPRAFLRFWTRSRHNIDRLPVDGKTVSVGLNFRMPFSGANNGKARKVEYERMMTGLAVR